MMMMMLMVMMIFKCYLLHAFRDEPEAEPESFEKVIMSLVKYVASAMREGNKIFKNSHHRCILVMKFIKKPLMFLSRNQSDAMTIYRVPFKIRKGLMKK
uniref:Secreted protein n=1 Tax=Lactuca sativa TaxID=4236 RepID=A0A9R1UIZ8_LACSA|nr:hypothetical protein LSAT_V11C900489330 [Lactuca sativa]